MKAKTYIPALLAFTLTLSSLPAMAEPRVDLLGEPAPATAADQTITIKPDTRYVNVQGGQIVNFDIAGQMFTWNFDGPEGLQSFDLNRVAPPGLLDHAVTAYVSPNPLYSGG
jgi:hypothetical protein